MYIGRKLLFHRRNVDDSIGTYATDYALAAFSFFVSGLMIYKMWRHRAADEANNPAKRKSGFSYWMPWNFPGKAITSVTMASYATVLFIAAYGAMAFLGGMPHEFLQKVEPYSVPSDGMVWLILWRCGAASSLFITLGFLILCEQLCQQESFLPLPQKARKVYYVVLFLGITAAFVENFVRLFDDDPYNITTIFLAFMAFVIVYAILTLAITMKSLVEICMRRRETADDKKSNSENQLSNETVRWDLILHTVCPWIIISGGVFSFLLTPYCSHHEDPHEAHGCPLPNAFNHNAVMHLVHCVAIACIATGENIAMNRRQRICRSRNNNKPISNRQDSTETWLLV